MGDVLLHVTSVPFSDIANRAIDGYAFLVSLLRMLCISIKYWNKYHVIFFLRSCYLKLMHADHILARIQFDKTSTEMTILMFDAYLITRILEQLATKSIKLKRKHVDDTDVWNAMQYRKAEINQMTRSRKSRNFRTAIR